MICPNCKATIEDGNLLCSSCGYEIQFVPEFEAEVNITIEDTIADISAGFVRAEENKKRNELKLKKQQAMQRKALMYKILAAIAVVSIFLVFICMTLFSNKAESNSANAASALAEGNIDKAISQAEKAYNKEPDNIDYCIQLARCYKGAGRDIDAKAMYHSALELDPDNIECFEGLIDLYKNSGDYDLINDLIQSSSNTEIRNMFSNYIAEVPAFSVEQGTFEEPVKLRLTSNTTGTIYYSLDGSTPGVTSEVYNGNIELNEAGIWTVSAIFINDFGIKSDVAVNVYEINLPTVDEIEITPESGSYSTPQNITVQSESGANIYYTSDGSTPNSNSVLYKAPIVLPLGHSTYKFISIDNSGNSGEVVEREYDFQLKSALDKDFATGLLINNLIAKGVILDGLGTSPKMGGVNRYVCNSAISVDGHNYYLFVEYYQDALENTTRTGSLYCIDADSGEIRKATTDNNGGYSISPF